MDKQLRIRWMEMAGDLFGVPEDSDYDIALIIRPGEKALFRSGEKRRDWHWAVHVEEQRFRGGSDTLEQAVSDAEGTMDGIVLGAKFRQQVAKRQKAETAMKRFLRSRQE